MITIGAYEAKTRLSELLDKVEQGEEVLITKHKRPVARLVPAEADQKRPPEEVVRDLLEFRKGHTLGDDLTVRDAIEEGRA